MLRLEFVPTILVFEQAKIFRALESSATVNGREETRSVL
jgi:hypothetical protein